MILLFQDPFSFTKKEDGDENSQKVQERLIKTTEALYYFNILKGVSPCSHVTFLLPKRGFI